jgi:hypothetical protein
VDQVAKLDQDMAIYQDFCRGMRKVTIADKYSCDRHTVTAAIRRARAAMPEEDRAEIFDQSTQILAGLLAVYVPLALAEDKAAGRLVDRLIGRRNEMLGLDSPAKLELYQAEHPDQQINIREELAILLGKIKADQHGE